MKLFAIVFLIASFAYANTPMDSIGVTKINQKLHVRYMVEPGETIYGISTRYGVSVSDILELNPELESGLKVGQVINIPYEPTLVKQQKKTDDNLIVHKVQPGETLYGLSKKYNISMQDLLKYNNMELKAGQELIIGYKNGQKPPTATTSNNNTSTSAPAKTLEPTETKKESATIAPPPVNPVVEKPAPPQENISPNYDPNMQQVLIVPFDPYLYFSDADDEIAARSNMPRTKVRQVFRRRLNAMLEAPGYENIYLLGTKAKDTLSDLNRIYSSVTYNYQEVINNPNLKDDDLQANASASSANKSWLETQKDKLAGNDPSDSKYDLPKDHGKYFGVKIKNPQEFFSFFNTKYGIDYYIFISQFEVKTNYEHCLDRAAQNFERTFTTHFSIYDSTGKQIAGNKFKTHYNSNSNNVMQIVADNMPKIAERILAELPKPDKK